MALRDKIRTNVQPLLEPGEQIQEVFVGQKVSGWFGALSSIVTLFANRYFIVAATDRRIAVFDSGKFSTTKPKALLYSLPRSIQIGSPQGLWWKCMTLGPKPIYVHKRFHKDVQAVDAHSAVGPAFQGSPLPPPVV